MAGGGERVHATCVAWSGRGVLLLGRSGSGKSDLALRLISLVAVGIPPAELVADDQVILAPRDGRLIASGPANLRGRIEVRGIGIVAVASRAEAPLALAVELVAAGEVERLPEPGLTWRLAGVAVPLVRLHAFEASAPLKIALALARV